MSEIKIMLTCDVYGSLFQMGPNIYADMFIPAYKMEVRKICFKGNWDGWATVWETKVIAHLESHGLAIPDRNYAGFIP